MPPSTVPENYVASVMGIFIVITLVVVFVAYLLCFRRFRPDMVEHKRIVITGSSTGLGEILACEYARMGVNLMLTARRGELLEEVAEYCRSVGARRVYVCSADMSIPEDRARLVASTIQSLGGVDQLILNHADLTMAQWTASPEDVLQLDHIMNINFTSYVDLASRFLPALKRNEGHIAVVSSTAGKAAFIGDERYAAAKHALHGFFSSWRQSLRLQGSKVSVTMCVLGPVSTKATLDKASNLIGYTNPQATANEIIRATTTRKREMYNGWFASVLVKAHRLFPAFVDDRLSNYYASLAPRQS